MIFVCNEVDLTKGAYFVMSYHGYEGWSIVSQHTDKMDALRVLTDNGGFDHLMLVTPIRYDEEEDHER